MLILRSILRHVCRFLKVQAERVARRLYRSSAVFTAGAALITVIAFTSAGFGSEGSNAMMAFAETPAPNVAASAGEESSTEAKVQVPQEQKIQQQENGQISEEERNNKQSDANAQAADAKMGAVDQAAASQSAGGASQSAEGATQASGSQGADPQVGESQGAGSQSADPKPDSRPAGEDAKAAAPTAAGDGAAEVQQADATENVHAMAISADDYQVLLKIVQAEAGICDEKGRILVANVVLNRVKSSQFPDSVRNVVYAQSQFSPVSNGSINSVKITDTTKQCVDRALAGEDYSQGALYFMNRRGARGGAVSWFDSHLTYLFSHDGHEFFK